MWPYNHCEWKTVTYGVAKANKWTKDVIGLVAVSAIPSVVLGLSLLLFVK